MQTTSEEFRRHFAGLSDEGLLAVNRGDLSAVACQALDMELARRGLAPPPVEDRPVPSPRDVVEWVTVGTFLWPAEAQFATQLLRSTGMTVYLANEYTLDANWNLSTALGWLQVQVPPSSVAEAHEILDSRVSDEELNAQAAVPASQQDD